MKEKNSFWIFSAKSPGPNIVTRAYKNNYLRLVSFCWAAVLKVIEKKLLEALTASIINSFTRKANILCLTEVMGRKTLGKRRIILRSHITCLNTWRICQTLACFSRSDCTAQRDVSRKISEGAGSGSVSEGTPRVQQILVKPMNGLFWQLLWTIDGPMPWLEMRLYMRSHISSTWKHSKRIRNKQHGEYGIF